MPHHVPVCFVNDWEDGLLHDFEVLAGEAGRPPDWTYRHHQTGEGQRRRAPQAHDHGTTRSSLPITPPGALRTSVRGSRCSMRSSTVRRRKRVGPQGDGACDVHRGEMFRGRRRSGYDPAATGRGVSGSNPPRAQYLGGARRPSCSTATTTPPSPDCGKTEFSSQRGWAWSLISEDVRGGGPTGAKGPRHIAIDRAAPRRTGGVGTGNTGWPSQTNCADVLSRGWPRPDEFSVVRFEQSGATKPFG